ncbi:MAG: hypothetical protein J2P37_09260 [Ktedonobacteraceae bacterium]|jgi:hypothetical protein|nr:hypothetical protein [Ktedonobacteraceae bacterium]
MSNGQYTPRQFPLKFIKSPKGMYPEAIAYLEQHGCVISPGIDHDLVEFPAGTLEMNLPQGHMDPRYPVRLPDGTVIYRMYLRARLNPDEHQLSMILVKEDAY